MEPLLIKGRYKVIKKLYTEHNYAALEAVDINDKMQATYLLNVYEGDYRRVFINCYTQLKHCGDYVGCFNYMDSLIAVFRTVYGKHIDDVFYKGASFSWEERLDYADKLFGLAISMADFPMEIATPLFLSENMIVRPEEKKVLVSCMAKPVELACPRELINLLIDQINKVLCPRFWSCNKELELLAVLNLRGYESIPEIYAYWLEMKRAIGAQYTGIYKKNALSRFLYMLWANVVRSFIHPKGR